MICSLIDRCAKRIWKDRAFWVKAVDRCAKATPVKRTQLSKRKGGGKTVSYLIDEGKRKEGERLF